MRIRREMSEKRFCLHYDSEKPHEIESSRACSASSPQLPSSNNLPRETPSTSHESSQYNCFVFWSANASNSSDIKVNLKGCWLDDGLIKIDSNCIERKKLNAAGYHLCQCSSDNCNEFFKANTSLYNNNNNNKINGSILFNSTADPFYPIPTSYSPSHPLVSTELNASTSQYMPFSSTLLAICYLIPTILFLVLFGLIFVWMYKFKKWRKYDTSNEEERAPIHCDNNKLNLTHKNIQLNEIKANGRLSTLWRGNIIDNTNIIINNCPSQVAVKIFSQNDRNQWLNELRVFQCAGIEHDNLIRFLGYDRRNDTQVVQHWIITEYYELGSLYDYLKTSTLNYDDIIKIVTGMARGLAYLHDEKPLPQRGQFKPPIAHRDFKSRNVLLANNLVAKISDFDLSIVFDRYQLTQLNLEQCGTKRYMAPEILEGAVDPTVEHLVRIDIYAFALVAWECLTRCTGDGKYEVDSYQLPYELELGQNPTFDSLQEAICQLKKRPILKDSWRNDPILGQICETIEECWDHDADSRLSASCATERFANINLNDNNMVYSINSINALKS